MRDVRLALWSVLPDRYTASIERDAHYARISGYADMTANILIAYFVIAVAGIALVDMPMLYRGAALLAAVPSGLVFPYAFFTVLADRRRKSIEAVLPDALLLMSANIESGLTVDKAFLLSARDEFGPLADDIRLAAMRMFGGMPVEEALEELAEDTNSELFAETLKLLVDGINSGGEVSKLLESSADDIRTSLQLRDEIYANVKMYSLFILIAAMFGAPLLFAVSTFLAETTSSLWAGQAANIGDVPTRGPISFSAPSLNVEFFRRFAIAALVVSNGFAALIISEIKDGNMKSGFKYVPLFILVSVAIYFGVSAGIQGAFGGIA